MTRLRRAAARTVAALPAAWAACTKRNVESPTIQAIRNTRALRCKTGRPFRFYTRGVARGTLRLVNTRTCKFYPPAVCVESWRRWREFPPKWCVFVELRAPRLSLRFGILSAVSQLAIQLRDAGLRRKGAYMRYAKFIRSAVLSAMLAVGGSADTAPAADAFGFGFYVHFGPPPILVYSQPICPGPGYLFTPGYWAYGDAGYYWVPGTWVQPPTIGFLWTPGYWGFGIGGYFWHPGYWGPHVGFYGGINYGFGYGGHGYDGGYWDHGRFNYNRAVNHLGEGRYNSYDRSVAFNNNHTSFNGGRGGIDARASREEMAAGRERHASETSEQSRGERAASENRAQFASNNHGRPETAATSRAGEFGRGNEAANRGGEFKRGAEANRGAENNRGNEAANRGGELNRGAENNRSNEFNRPNNTETARNSNRGFENNSRSNSAANRSSDFNRGNTARNESSLSHGSFGSQNRGGNTGSTRQNTSRSFSSTGSSRGSSSHQSSHQSATKQISHSSGGHSGGGSHGGGGGHSGGGHSSGGHSGGGHHK